MRYRKERIDLVWEEPFRIFFPAGLLMGAVGVALWPLLYLGFIGTYPSVSHARLMTEGFVTCFIFGFLGTAGPRVMSVRHLSSAEILRAFFLVVAACTLHLLDKHAFGDALFVAALISFTLSLCGRFRQRRDSPPSNFALVGAGILNGVFGAALLTFCEATQRAPTLYRLASSFLNIGFGLLPILGLAPFFLRRLLNFPSDAEPSTPRRTLVIALLLIVVIDSSFVTELYNNSPIWAWFRAACVLAWLLITVPMSDHNALAASLRLSLASIVAGLGLLALLPAYRISVLHIIFIGGFAQTILTVATRVILGHSGELAIVRGRISIFVVALFLLIFAMMSRFVADLSPARNEHLLWGAVCWLIALAIWAVIVLPRVARVEDGG